MPDWDAAQIKDDDFESFVDAVQELLHDLGVPGVFSSRKALAILEKLFDLGVSLEVVQRGILTGFDRKTKRGKEVRGLSDLLPTIRAEARRSGVPDA
ncbi:MAG: hypothetical protein CMH54_04815 [Myxococcales bacterium]|nr:hypothetical protein [Myxococcales bacterium]|tara:strand:+ start:423 stop:713 length:291 start_codon:yes stop_codon:yes gene_type:complete